MLRKEALKYKVRMVLGIIAAFWVIPFTIGLFMFGIQSALPAQPLKVADKAPDANDDDKVTVKGKTRPNASVHLEDTATDPTVDKDTKADDSGHFRFKNLSAEKSYDITLNYWDAKPESIRVSPNNKELTQIYDTGDDNKGSDDTSDITNKKNSKDAIE